MPGCALNSSSRSSSRRARRRAVKTRLRPLAERIRAIPAPRPELAPVIKTFLRMTHLPRDFGTFAPTADRSRLPQGHQVFWQVLVLAERQQATSTLSHRDRRDTCVEHEVFKLLEQR